MAELKFTYDPNIDRPTALQVVMNSVQSLIDQGFIAPDIEEAVLDIVFDDTDSTITAVIDDSRMLDQLRSQDYIDSVKFEDLVENTVRTYSIRTIKERLRLSELPLKKQIRYFILDYRRYYKMNLKEFIANPEEFYRLKAQFITDFMGFMNIVLKEAAEGGNLAKLLGLTALVPKANSAGRKLGVDYKQINKVGGAPRSLMERTQMHFHEFIDAITDIVFKGWRSKIAGQEELPEEPDEDLIENEEITEEVPEMEEYSNKTFSSRKNEGKIRELYKFIYKGTDMIDPDDPGDLDALIDCVYLGLGSDDPDEFVEKLIDQAKRVAKSRKEELPKELSTFSDTLEGEESEGEDVEMTPAEIELLHRESEFNGDGKRLYSAMKSIDDKELLPLDDKNNPIIDINALKAQGYTKWCSVNEISDEDLRSYLANGAITMSNLLFIKDEPKVDLGEEVKFKKFSEDRNKLQWGYTKDLIKQGYNESPLTTKYLQMLYDKGLKKFYMFEDLSEGDRMSDKVLDKATDLGLENDYEYIEMQDTELGKIGVLFTSSKVAKYFSKSMKKFNK